MCMEGKRHPRYPPAPRFAFWGLWSSGPFLRNNQSRKADRWSITKLPSLTHTGWFPHREHRQEQCQRSHRLPASSAQHFACVCTAPAATAPRDASGSFYCTNKACTPAELPNCHPPCPTDGSMPTGLLLQANLSCCRGAEERCSLPQRGQGWSMHAPGALLGFHRNCHRVRKGPVPPH